MNKDFYLMVADFLTEQEAKEDRRKLRPWVQGAIGAGCAIALFIAAFNAIGAEVLKSKSETGVPFTLKLHNEPCANIAVLGHLAANVQAKFIPEFRRATLTWAGKEFAACWLDYNGWVLVYDQEGDPFNPPTGVPRSAFKDDTI